MPPNSHENSLYTTVLYERYGSALLRFLRQRIASREEAEDVQGDIFTAILENPSMRSWSEETQQRWMWRVARNKVIDVYRASSRLERVPLEEVCDELYDDERYTPEQTVLQREAATLLDEAVCTLPPLQQRLLKWRFVYGMRYIDIAGRLGKSEEAVRAQLFRTLKVLRRMYQERKNEP